MRRFVSDSSINVRLCCFLGWNSFWQSMKLHVKLTQVVCNWYDALKECLLWFGIFWSLLDTRMVALLLEFDRWFVVWCTWTVWNWHNALDSLELSDVTSLTIVCRLNLIDVIFSILCWLKCKQIVFKIGQLAWILLVGCTFYAVMAFCRLSKKKISLVSWIFWLVVCFDAFQRLEPFF